MIQQQILAIPFAAQLEVDRINELIRSAAEYADEDTMDALMRRRDALLAEREPRPIAIGERF